MKNIDEKIKFKSKNIHLKPETIALMKQAIILCYIEYEGNITRLTQEMLYIQRGKFYNWVKKDKDFKEKIEKKKLELKSKNNLDDYLDDDELKFKGFFDLKD